MKLAALYHEHAVFAFPSTFEGQPLVLLEAAASGLAIATTRTCGMKDFVSDGQNGLLVEVGDAEGFARAVSRLVESAGLAAELGRAAREIFANVYIGSGPPSSFWRPPKPLPAVQPGESNHVGRGESLCPLVHRIGRAGNADEGRRT